MSSSVRMAIATSLIVCCVIPPVAAQQAGPRLDRDRAAAVGRVSNASPSAATSESHPDAAMLQDGSGAGKAGALIAVGVAGIVVGGLVRDEAGAIIMIAGGIVGLYGLYLWARAR